MTSAATVLTVAGPRAKEQEQGKEEGGEHQGGWPAAEPPGRRFHYWNILRIS